MQKRKKERPIIYDQETCLYSFHENSKKEKNRILSSTPVKLIEKVSFTI